MWDETKGLRIESNAGCENNSNKCFGSTTRLQCHSVSWHTRCTKAFLMLISKRFTADA